MTQRLPPQFASTRMNLTLAVLYVVLAAAYFATSEGLLDYSGHVIGRDFAYLWTAGHAVAAGNSHVVLDPAALNELHAHLLAPVPSDYNWSYPPPMLFVAVPFGTLGYPLALMLWSAVTLGLYIWASRVRGGVCLYWWHPRPSPTCFSVKPVPLRPLC